MNKSSFIDVIKGRKQDIAVVLILAMFSGFLVSRAVLSISMLLLGLNALWNVPPRKWLEHRWWLIGACWIGIYALTWFWSDDKGAWNIMFTLKLPILLLPLAFSFLQPFTARQLTVLTLGIGAMLLGGAGYSISFLLRDYAHYIQEYNVSHMIPTPVYGEYICFSISCALYVVWVIAILPLLNMQWVRWVSMGIALLLATYIHILASKSGIIALYVFVMAYGVYTLVALRKLAGLVVLVAIPAVFILAINFVPTLYERKEHVIYTYYRYMDHDRTGKLGDLSRLYSYDIAIKLISEYPLAGTGTGDLLSTMKVGYAKWHPEVTEERNQLIPHNQFLTVGVACGIPALLLFTVWVFMPLRRLGRNRESFFFFVVWLLLLFQLMIEPFLEGQFGVFVYIFFLLLFRQVLPPKKSRGQVYNRST